MDTATTTLVSIGDNHYVDPATGLIFSQVGYRNMYGYMVMDHDGKRGVGQHRLVYEATKGPIPDGLVVNHINSVRHDNRPENLEAVTHRENMEHMHIMGRHPQSKPGAQGERSHMAKLSDVQVEDFRKRHAGGESVPKLSTEFGISRSYGYKLIRSIEGRSRAYGSGPVATTRKRDKLAPEQRAEIARRIAAGEFAPDVAEEFGVTPVHVYALSRSINGPLKVPVELTAGQERDIRTAHRNGSTVTSLARTYGVGHRRIQRLVS